MELFILFIGAFLGGLGAWAINVKKENMKIILAFSGAFMLGLSFFHLLPESYQLLGANAGAWVLAGFMLQILLEIFSQGMEHGHAHALKDEAIPFGLFIGLGVHALLEGLPFSGHEGHAHHSLLAGVLIHKVPVAFILGTVLRGAGFSFAKGALAIGGFAAMAPLGGLLSLFIGTKTATQMEHYHGIILAVIVGIFLHIATTIIFESDKGHAFNLTKLVAILLGFILAFLAA